MANRIITFQLDPIQKRLQDNPLEVFLDISMIAKPEDHGISVAHIIPPMREPNYVTLKDEDKYHDVEFILDTFNTDEYTRILTYIHDSDYDDYVLDGDSIEKYYQLLATDPKDENLSCILTDPYNDDSLYLGILSSNDYSTDTKIVVEYIHNYTHTLNRLVNVNAIRNSLHNIFTWIPGQRVLLPEFGSNLRKLLYEGITDYNVELIIAEIKQIVSRWEPRVLITNIVDVSTVDDHENNTVHIKIIYIIPGLSDEQFEYDYVLPIAEY